MSNQEQANRALSAIRAIYRDQDAAPPCAPLGDLDRLKAERAAILAEQELLATLTVDALEVWFSWEDPRDEQR
jgi:hypothetical protein